MDGYFSGVIGMTDEGFSGSTPNVETYMALRRATIGVYPCLAMVE